jgi:cytochrome b
MEPEKYVAIKVWDLPTRLFHWAIFGLVVLQVITGEIGGEVMAWHLVCGYGILTLVVFRIAWGFAGSTHARFASFIVGPAATYRFARRLFSRQAVPQVGHNPLGGWMVMALVLSLLVQAASGLFSNDGAGNEGPLSSLVSLDVSNIFRHVHEWNLQILLVLSGLHLAGVLFHWLVKKENLVGAMFSGVKRVPVAVLRERREALRGTPRRRAASREWRSAYFASPLRALVVLVASIVAVYLATRGWR